MYDAVERRPYKEPASREGRDTNKRKSHAKGESAARKNPLVKKLK